MSYFHTERMPVLPARRRTAARLQLEEIVRRSAARPKRRPPAVIAAMIAIVVLGAGAAAFAVASHQPVTNKHLARCFTTADVSGFATTITVPGKPGSAGQVNNARAVCAALFHGGYLKQGVAGEIARPKAGKHPGPHLVVCTWSDESAAVFPGRRGTCAKLGLPAAARR